MNDNIGVFIAKDGPIDVKKDMSKEDMWTVLEWAMKEIIVLRGNQKDLL